MHSNKHAMYVSAKSPSQLHLLGVVLLQVKAEFMEMLSEDGSLTESSQWRKVKGGLERDPRYRAVSGGSSQREEWFLEYVKSSATGSTGKVGWLSDLRENGGRIHWA